MKIESASQILYGQVLTAEKRKPVVCTSYHVNDHVL